MIAQNEFVCLLGRALGANNLSKFDRPSIYERFYRLTSRLLSANEHMNLTAVTDVHDIVIKHYVDSIMCADTLPLDACVADIGTGAGFPALPLSIVRPDLRIVAVDSIGKRTDYVRSVVADLGLKNVSVLNARAEALGADSSYRQKFDAVCSRAVAELRVLCELCLPLARLGGRMVALKGAKGHEELDSASNAIETLGGEVKAASDYTLKSSDDPAFSAERTEIVIYKFYNTPDNYPRKYSRIIKNPL